MENVVLLVLVFSSPFSLADEAERTYSSLAFMAALNGPSLLVAFHTREQGSRFSSVLLLFHRLSLRS